MRTAGPRTGAALGLGLGLALLAGGPLTGCSTGPGPRTPTATATPRATATATTPEALCARLVTYWAHKALDEGTYGDYQSMGLSNRQYDILTGVVDAARAERARAGRPAADRLVDRRARTRCARLHREAGPTERPWQ